MKVPSTDLFELIRSLSSQEKKYFKQYSSIYSQGRDNGYLLLFDAIDAQQTYDEQAIKTKFKGKAVITNLSVAKIYLTEKILDSLIAMYGESDEAMLLRRRISYFEILERRRLISGAHNAYKKAYDMAIETGNLTMLPHIARYKNSIVSNSGKSISPAESIANAEQAIAHARILENYLQYELLSLRANALMGDPTLHIDLRKKQALDELLTDPLLSGQDPPLSFKAWCIMTRLRYRINWVKSLSADCYDILQNAIEYLNANKKDTTEWQSNLLRFYVDFIDLSLKLNYFDKGRELLNEFARFIELKYEPQVYAMQWHFTFTIIFHSVSGLDIGGGIRYWEEHSSWWAKEQSKFRVTTQDKLLFHVLTLYFMAADWSSAIRVLNELITHKYSSQTERAVRIYWLMIQYEIQNIELLQAQASSVRDWFRKSDVIADVEKEVIHFFEKIHRAAGKKEVLTRMKELHEKLTERDKITRWTSTSATRDMLFWLESKIANTTMDKVLQSTIKYR